MPDTHHLSKPNDVALEKFNSQLTQDENGCYQTNFISKEGQRKLKNNRAGSLGRLKNLMKNFQQEPQKFKSYNENIKAQIANRIVKRATVKTDSNKEHYLQHKTAVSEGIETTKLRVASDASSKSSRESQSLNAFLENGPPLQNLLRDILVHNRFKSYDISADDQKAFLQIRIRDFFLRI